MRHSGFCPVAYFLIFTEVDPAALRVLTISPLLLTCADSFVNDAGNAIQKCKLNAHELVVIDVELANPSLSSICQIDDDCGRILYSHALHRLITRKIKIPYMPNQSH